MCSAYATFLMNFRLHWALFGIGSHAIRPRICSPNTLFSFCIFLKKAPWRPSNESLVESFLTKYVIFVWKNGFQKLLQKRCPSRFKQHSIRRPGGSRRGSLTCALYKQDTVVWAAVEALFEIFAEKSGLDWKLVLKMTGLLNCSQKNWMDCWLLKTKASVERKC